MAYELDEGDYEAQRIITKSVARLDAGDYSCSSNERRAAAVVGNRADWLIDDPDGDFRMAMIRMGPQWAHAAVDLIFQNWDAYMRLRPSDPACPKGSALIRY